MHKKIRKTLLTVLSALILSAPIVGTFSSKIVNADSVESYSNNQGNETQTFIVPHNNVILENPNSISESKLGSGAIKYAIKQVLKHPRVFASYIGKFMGKGAEKAVLRSFNKEIAPRLKPLLKYTDGLEDAVAMAVYRGVKAATHNEYLANMAKVGAKIAIGLM
ncbi:hypothetical protein J2Z60_001472 [Lactobacillus colini]|uniref:Uncharacterized protein n=1 Tax=Lactobacillus colini TaxID=1819254 RepID=A0ABS4MF49_9LACO|nr:hypothetical protein [Lactobacillus colini]MBP2058293.1 hypothetical protein [Lactobacillus colini]